MNIGDAPARCTLWFYGPGASLSGLMCELDGIQHRDGIQRRDVYTQTLDRIRHRLEKRYGAPSEESGDRDDQMHVGLAETKDTFLWEWGGNSLVLEGEFRDIDPSFYWWGFNVTGPLTRIVVKQTTAAHRLSVSPVY